MASSWRGPGPRGGPSRRPVAEGAARAGDRLRLVQLLAGGEHLDQRAVAEGQRRLVSRQGGEVGRQLLPDRQGLALGRLGRLVVLLPAQHTGEILGGDRELV